MLKKIGLFLPLAFVANTALSIEYKCVETFSRSNQRIYVNDVTAEKPVVVGRYGATLRLVDVPEKNTQKIRITQASQILKENGSGMIYDSADYDVGSEIIWRYNKETNYEAPLRFTIECNPI